MQMMGRAARHQEGHAVLYADRVTGSMQRAIDETNRRRQVQEEYNKKHNITPKTVVREISGTRLAGGKKEITDDNGEEVDVTKMSTEETKFYLHELNEQMDLAAQNLEFELAARIRDKIEEIKKLRKLSKKK
jgi:excinuclease ABC subunit B